MKILIEFYDRSILKNLVGVLGICPDIVKYFYDPDIFSYRGIYSTYDACRKYIPGLKYEVGKVDEYDYDNIVTAVSEYISECSAEDEIFIDLTGGSELSVIAAYDAGRKSGCHIYFTDSINNSIINLSSPKDRYRCMPFEIQDMISAFGGKMLGHTDDHFLKENKTALFHMAKYILKYNSEWQKTCQYFQKRNTALRQNTSLQFSGRFEHPENNSYDIPNMQFIYELSHQRLIHHLTESSGHFSFEYKNSKIMDYISSFGVWLELYTYYHVLNIPGIHDVHTSIKIDWNAADQSEIIGNEIDVTAMYGCRPILISCKQSASAVNANMLNEIYVVSRRIGGKYAIPILITYSHMRDKHMGLYLKAKEMGICLLDYNDIMSEHFSEKIRRIVCKHIK